VARHPALDVRTADPDFALALVDDYSPVAAVAGDDATITIFFTDASRRDRAGEAIAARLGSAVVVTRDIDDEDWARRSQQNLTPVTVGRITVSPPWFGGGAGSSGAGASPAPRTDANRPPAPHALVIIEPSMGFGTGHHATTRLCLAALQELDLTDRFVLDIGTGSGVLALAAKALGAARVVGIDIDPDAIQSAKENLVLNPALTDVAFEVGDVSGDRLPTADIVTANLTGALLIRTAAVLLGAARPGGRLLLSGLLDHEGPDVVGAFSPPARLERGEAEDGWLALVFRA
jgi:ribosomal protein L11 methyltransferase